ncbi:MBL fold metallo-hydrolase [Synergistales bacterium]|nr:MBL fold metallo-hydrolase [Synergistales bacterium]
MVYDFGDGIYGVDAHYLGEGIVSVYIVRGADGSAALIDTGHNAAFPYISAGLGELGISKEAVRYVCATHVHLDHAGGAGICMREFPNATLVVHPRGARHMIDPAKLMAGAEEVYGKEEADRTYGTLVPIPEERVHTAGDNEEVNVGGILLTCLHTPGHALHHMAYHYKAARSVFTGDSFGVSLPRYDADFKGRCFVVPTTSPVQFDPEAMISSIDRIEALAPERLYLTHFGELRDVPERAAELRRLVRAHRDIGIAAKGDVNAIKKELTDLFVSETQNIGWDITDEVMEIFNIDIFLNSQGVSLWYNRHKGD